MEVWELLAEIIKKTKEVSSLKVMIDGTIPRPFEEVFKIKQEKGFLLFIEKEKEEKNEN